MGEGGAESPVACPKGGAPTQGPACLPTCLYTLAPTPCLQKLAGWHCRWVRKEQAWVGAWWKKNPESPASFPRPAG